MGSVYLRANAATKRATASRRATGSLQPRWPLSPFAQNDGSPQLQRQASSSRTQSSRHSSCCSLVLVLCTQLSRHFWLSERQSRVQAWSAREAGASKINAAMKAARIADLLGQRTLQRAARGTDLNCLCAWALAGTGLADEDAAVIRGLLRTLFGLRRAFRKQPAERPAQASDDPRAQDPWVAGVLADLGERYQLGPDKPEGVQILRRTGRARFNPMMVFLAIAGRAVVGFYEVRGHGDKPEDVARALLDARITGELAVRGLSPAGDRVEDWGGTVLIRRYQGTCDDSKAAANAVRFMCQQSDQIMDTAAE